jgi:predicted amidohydrolase
MGLIKTAVVQMGAEGTKEENLATALRLIDEAVERFGELDLLVLPEYCYGEPTAKNVKEMAESLPGSFSEAMAAKARAHKVNLVAGSFAEAAPDGRAYNTTLIFDRAGEEIGQYRKTHLMDAMAFVESSFVAPGDSLCVIDTDVGRIGVEVCYDLRFPEQARTMALQGAEIIVVPAAFPSGQPLPPRTDHWDTLTTSTALLNLCYVVTSNQFGKLPHDYPFGRSAIIDPWGIAVAKAQGREDIIYGQIDLEYVKALRQKLPTLEQRRTDLYDVG